MTRRNQAGRPLWASMLALLLVAAVLGVGAWAARLWWRSGAELRATLELPATPGPQHPGVDCAGLLRSRPMVILLLGQSNAANHVQTRAAAGSAVYTWHQGECHAAVDPLPGASGEGGSLWTRLAVQLQARGGHDTVLLVPLAISATSARQWASHPVLVERLHSVVTGLARTGFAVTHVLWYQGEADSFKNTTGQAYQEAFAEVRTRLRQLGVLAPIWVAQATLCQARSNPAVRAAQAALPRQFADVRAGPDMDALFGPLHRYDGCHFSTDSAKLAAHAWLQALLPAEAPELPAVSRN